MGNRIKRTTDFLIAKANLETLAFGCGEPIGIYKNEWGRWITTDTKGKGWQVLVAHIRNDALLTILEQYTYEDIAYWLQQRNPNYQTVMWDMLIDAIKTTLKETNVASLEGIYQYIAEHLL